MCAPFGVSLKRCATVVWVVTQSENQLTDDPNTRLDSDQPSSTSNSTDEPNIAVRTLASTKDVRTDGPAIGPNARWLWNQSQPDQHASYIEFPLLDERYVVRVEAVDEEPEWVDTDD